MDAVLKTIISIAGILITYFLVPLLKNKLDAANYDKVLKLIQTLVEAAEESLGEKQGEEKREYVENALFKKGIDPDKFTHEIQAAALKLHSNGENYAEAHQTHPLSANDSDLTSLTTEDLKQIAAAAVPIVSDAKKPAPKKKPPVTIVAPKGDQKDVNTDQKPD